MARTEGAKDRLPRGTVIPETVIPPSPSKARVYSETDKAEYIVKVAEFDGSTTKAAKATGVPARTLRRWWHELTEEQRDGYLRIAKDRQEAWWQDIHDAALVVCRAKIKDLSPKDAVIAAGIAFDKLQLLRGQSTSNVGTLSADADALAKSVEDILSKAGREATRAALKSE